MIESALLTTQLLRKTSEERRGEEKKFLRRCSIQRFGAKVLNSNARHRLRRNGLEYFQ